MRDIVQAELDVRVTISKEVANIGEFDFPVESPTTLDTTVNDNSSVLPNYRS